MKTKFKLLLFFLILSSLFSGITGYFMYHKPHKDLGKVKPDYVMNAESLFSTYADDEAIADAMYLDKVIRVSGKVKDISPTPGGGSVIMIDAGDEMFGINCAFPEAPEKLKPGDEITLAGLCTGMLLDVNLSRCVRIF